MDGLKCSSHAVSNSQATSQFSSTMTKHLLDFARRPILFTLLVLNWLLTSKNMNKLYMSNNALELNCYMNIKCIQITMYIFDQLCMWKETLHQLGDEYQCVSTVYFSLMRATSKLWLL
jgi:hypothetical protein